MEKTLPKQATHLESSAFNVELKSAPLYLLPFAPSSSFRNHVGYICSLSPIGLRNFVPRLLDYSQLSTGYSDIQLFECFSILMTLCGEEIDPILGDMTVPISHNISMVPSESTYALSLVAKGCPEFPLSNKCCALAYMVNEFLANRSKYHTKSHRASAFTAVAVIESKSITCLLIKYVLKGQACQPPPPFS